MWPLYILLNKFLRTEEENGRGPDGDHLTAVEAYSFERSLSNDKYNDAVLPHSHFIEVPLINQQCTWDCGLACILMVLRTLGIGNCNIQELGELCCTTSVWTVDLAYLLQKFSVSFSYFTVTLGANPNFSVETFYKEQLPNDLVRVDMLFQKALESGMNIQCRSISGEEISLLILSGKYIAIALVDQYKLSQSWLEDVWVSGCYSGNSGYTGHYVVICGYDAVTDEFEIRDPASSRKHEKVTSKRLEEARKSFGTDEDLLLMPSLHILVMKNDTTPNIEAITAVLAGLHRSPFSLPKLFWSGLEPLHCRISLENGENQNTPSIQLSSLVTFDT